MSTQTEQKAPSATLDKTLVFIAIAVAVAGLLAFTFLTDETLTVRIVALAGGLVLGAVIAAFSPSGKRFFAYGRNSYEELRRVVWPTRRETINTTGMVSAFAVAVAIYLFLIDKLVQWAMYDGLLKLTF
jgi:preprotein translocase subunit SecE